MYMDLWNQGATNTCKMLEHTYRHTYICEYLLSRRMWGLLRLAPIIDK